jgi:ankyrin repeat protein
LHDLEILEQLLHNGADPNTVNHMGDPAVLVATQNRNEKCAIRLIQAGCDLNIFNPKHGRSALFWAVDHQMVDLTNYMIENGADVNAGTSGLPLDVAVRNNDSRIVNILLENGVDVNKRIEPERATSLLYALDNSFDKISKKLLDAGADPNAETIYEVTSLMLGRKRPAKDNIIERLVEKGVNVNYKAFRGYSVIYPSAVKALLNAGGNPNTTNEAGDSPLIKAALYNRIEVAQLLICSNCDIDHRGKCYTACQVALIRPRSFRIARLLIAAGCDLGFVFHWEKTCYPEHLEEKPVCISWLLKKASEPRKLTLICRKTILNALGLGTCTSQEIDALPLPPHLTKYLKYHEFNKRCFDDYDGDDDDDYVAKGTSDDDDDNDDDTGSKDDNASNEEERVDSSSSSEDCVIS